MLGSEGRMVEAFRIFIAIFCLRHTDGKVTKKGNLMVLYDDLMDGYNKNVRPVLKNTDAVQVHANMKMQQIISMDGRNEVLHFTAQLEMIWPDAYLSWNFTEQDIFGLVMPSNRVWLPDINIANSAGNVRELNWFDNVYVFINNTGFVYWKIRSDYAVTCALDMTYFPFDTQKCDIDVATQELSTFDANLTNGGRTKMLMDEFQENGEWKLIDTSTESREYNFADKNVPFPYVRFSVYLERRPMFYILNMILPCIMLSFLQLCVFITPPPSGEKISLSITVLLSFTVFLLIVSESMPQTSTNIPLLGIYLICTLAVSMLSLMITVLVLQVYHRHPDIKVPPILILLIRALGMVTCQFQKLDKFRCAVGPKVKASTVTDTVEKNILKSADDDNRAPSGMNGLNQDDKMDNNDVLIKVLMSQTNVLNNILAELQGSSGKTSESYEKAWILAAAIIDRFFAVLFLTIVVVVNFVMLYVIPLYAN